MEWVETTGRTVDEAKEAALDELGVDETDAEFDVLAEQRMGLFGRLRSEARVRARVRPTAPRAKDDRRDRRRRRRDTQTDGSSESSSSADDNGATGEAERPEDVGSSAPGAPRRNRNRRRRGSGSAPGGAGGAVKQAAGASGSERDRGRTGTRRQPSASDEEVSVDVDLDTQAGVAKDFLSGLVHEFDLPADIRVERPDPDTVDVHVDGTNLGLLIGQKGATLLALQDLARTVVQRQTGATNGRLHVDVAGYRHKRAEALGRFARQVANEVRSSGVRKALEPMPAPDRKVVHDAVAEVPGVSSQSEGEDSERRVVISPQTT
jgi:spoIIIJ-associated protein